MDFVIRLLFLCFLTHAYAARHRKIIECPLNEEYSECGANNCQNTCENPQNALVCKDQCKEGCVCVEGFLRNQDGVCIPAEQCDVSCDEDENAVLSNCFSLCPITCGNKDFPPLCPIVCNPLEPRCVCKPGYILDYVGVTCVLPKDCQIKCDKNEIFNPCGTCDPTCDDLYPECPEVCIPGCYCENGHVRDDCGNCVEIEQCP